MIVSRLTDGLGNQMFQYAAGRRLAHHHGTALILDVSLYANQPPSSTPRVYELNFFRIRAATVQADLTRVWMNPPFTVVSESKLFAPNFAKAPDNTYLVGYWQSEYYFKGIQSLILSEFTPADSANEADVITSRKIERSMSVSIHIRRGDYVNNKFHSLLGLDYYRAAVDAITKKVQSPHFFVFSDDPEWCGQNLDIGYPYTLVTHNSGRRAYWDIILMSRCQHNIIANSSFSWWGAWLNRNPGKIVIAPKQWFGDPSVDTSDRVPDRWIRL
jgi:hypothetical protein